MFYFKDRLNHIGPEEFILHFMTIESKSQNEIPKFKADDERTNENVKFGSKRFSQLLGFFKILSKIYSIFENFEFVFF